MFFARNAQIQDISQIDPNDHARTENQACRGFFGEGFTGAGFSRIVSPEWKNLRMQARSNSDPWAITLCRGFEVKIMWARVPPGMLSLQNLGVAPFTESLDFRDAQESSILY